MTWDMMLMLPQVGMDLALKAPAVERHSIKFSPVLETPTKYRRRRGDLDGLSIVAIPHAKKVIDDFKPYSIPTQLHTQPTYKEKVYKLYLSNFHTRHGNKAEIWNTLVWQISTKYGYLAVYLDQIPIYTTKVDPAYLSKMVLLAKLNKPPPAIPPTLPSSSGPPRRKRYKRSRSPGTVAKRHHH